MYRFLFFFLVFLLTACNQSDPVPEANGKVLQIGVVGPMTGPDAHVGKSGLVGAQVALSLRTYLEDGTRVEFLIEDDQHDPAKTVAAVERLQSKGVVGVILLSQSECALAVRDLPVTTRMPVVATIATHPELTANRNGLIQLSFDDRVQGAVAAMFVRDELLIDRVSIFRNSSDPYSNFLADEFTRRFEKAYGEIVVDVDVADADASVREALQRAESSQSELLYLPLSGEDVLRVMEFLNGRTWQPAVMSSDGLVSDIILKYEQDVERFSGIYVTDILTTLTPKTEFGRKVTEAYHAQDRQAGSTFSIPAAEAVALLMSAMNRTTDPGNPQAVFDMIPRLKRVVGFHGTLSVTGSGQAVRPVYVSRIDGTELDPIFTVY